MPTTSEKSWEQWFDRCAYLRCDDGVQMDLGKFALSRYSGKKGKGGLPLQQFDDMIGGAESAREKGYRCWADLEMYFYDLRTIAGRDAYKSGDLSEEEKEQKTWKSWLQTRVQNREYGTVVSAAESNTLSIITTLIGVRRRAEAEFGVGDSEIQLKPLDIDSGDKGYFDLEDEDQTAQYAVSDCQGFDEIRTTRAMGDEIAEELFASFGAKERTVLAATKLELSLADPRVEEAAGCKKSVLSSWRSDKLDLIVQTAVTRKLPEEDSLVREAVTYSCEESLATKSLVWAENEAPRLFI